MQSLRWAGRMPVGRGSYIHSTVHLLGKNNIRVGENSCVSEGGWLNVNHVKENKVSIEIGNDCFIGKQNFFTSGDYMLTTVDCKFIGSIHKIGDRCWFACAARHSTEPLNMSAGEQLIDLVHIDDVTEAYVIAAQRLLGGQVSPHERYAVSSGNPLPLKELVQIYAEVTGQNVLVNWGARPCRDREVMVPWNRGNSLPDWKPTISLIDGINSTINNLFFKA